MTSPHSIHPYLSLALGGIDRVAATTGSILREHDIDRSIFAERELRNVRHLENLLLNGMAFEFDVTRSIASNFHSIIKQAECIASHFDRENFVDTMLQHLVGAKLDIVLGVGIAKHHGFSVADHSTERQGDFEVNGVAIHVTTHPTEALIRKVAANIRSGLKPVIVTLADGVEGAGYLLKNTEWVERVDVIDATQFLTANVYERSLFKAGECKTTLTAILTRYNEIVAACERDPVLVIRF